MALGYGYVRDDDPVQVNWSEISKNFTDRIKADQVDRQKRKDDIQEKYNELQKDLINKPQGYNTDLNKVVGSFAGQASTASLDLLNKLKRGEISEQEYYTKRANLKSSTENFFLYSKNFNDNYSRLMDLAKSNDPNKRLSAKAIYQMGLATDMLDFKNTTAIIDPGTNELILVKTDEDGNPTNEIVNVSQLGYLSSDEELSYNYKQKIADSLKLKGTKKYKDSTGKEVITILGAELDSTQANEAIDAVAESLLGDESQVISILAQNGYEFTQDENMKGEPNTIYYDINTNKYEYDRQAAKDILVEEVKGAIPETVLEVEQKTAAELLREELEIEALQNQVELGDIKISEALKKIGKDLSTFNSQLEADINNSLGDDFNDNYANNRKAFLRGDTKKAKNALEASLAKLNEYGAWAGVEVRLDGSDVIFSTPVFNSKGQMLDEPFELTFDVTNIKSGQQLQNTMQAFISNYSDPQFINNAYNTGKFTEPEKAEEEPVPDDRTEIVLSFGTISVPSPEDKKQYLSLNEFKQDYPQATFNDYLIYSRPDLASEPSQ